MKIISTREISIILALAFSIVLGCILGIIQFPIINSFIWNIIAAFLIFIIAIYLILYFTLKDLVDRKIKQLFDNIQMPVDKLYQSIEDGRILSEKGQKVMEWAKSKVNEIDILKANEKYRKEFLSNVSHELKTPLFNLQGYVLTLIDGGLKDDEINMKYLKRSNKNINRLISMVKDLETISQLETGERLLEYQVFDIVLLISEVFEMHEIRAKRKNITLTFDKQYQEPILVNADKKRMLEVLANLIINSIIYGKEGGTTIINISSDYNRIYIAVSDNGIGIEQKYLNRLFERFFRVDKSRSKIQGGTGLGLAIVKHIIEAHKQQIKVESTFGVGTKFTFSLEKSK